MLSLLPLALGAGVAVAFAAGTPDSELQRITTDAIEQNVGTLRNRINELGYRRLSAVLRAGLSGDR